MPHKIILVAVNEDTAVPTVLNGLRVIKNEGNEKAFVNQIIAEILDKMRQFR